MAPQYSVRLTELGEKPEDVVGYLEDELDQPEDQIEELAAENGVIRDRVDIQEAADLSDALRERGATVNVESDIPLQIYRLEGTVRRPDGAAVPAVTVRVLNGQVDPPEKLGETTSDSDGSFSLEYHVSTDAIEDIVLRVQAVTDDQVLARSHPMEDPDRNETVTLEVAYPEGETAEELNRVDSNEVFRFMTLRPPEKIDKSTAIAVKSFHGEDESDLYASVMAARESGEDRVELMVHARDALDSGDAAAGFEDLQLPLDEFGAQVRDGTSLDSADVGETVEAVFGRSASELVDSDAFRDSKRRIADGFLATTVLPAQEDAHEELVEASRLVDLVERTATGDQTLDGPNGVDSALERTVTLPADLFPLPGVERSAAEPDAQSEDQLEDSAQEVREEIDRTRAAIDALANLQFSEGQPQEADDSASVESLERSSSASELDISEFLSTANRLLKLKETEQELTAGQGRPSDSATHDLTTFLATTEAMADSVPSPSPTTTEGEAKPWVLRPELVDELDDETRAVLDEVDVQPGSTDVVEAIEQLEQRAEDLGDELFSLTGGSEPSTPTIPLGDTYHETGDFFPTSGHGDLFGDMSGDAFGDGVDVPTPDLPGLSLDGDEESSTAKPFQPIFGDLNLVRERVTGYRMREISDVANVLQGEKKKRTHRRALTTEETFLRETETTEEETRDLQTTERFELEKEAEEQLEEENKFSTGLTISASYGSSVEIESSTKYERRNSKAESARTARSYARDVTDRTVNRVQKRIREKETRRVVEEMENTNVHEFDNTDDDKHISGIYRWLEKVYKAQVFKYDQRMIMEFIVPEPSAFYIHSRIENPSEHVAMERPEPPTVNTIGDTKPLKPSLLTSSNYQNYIQQYGVSDVDPWPQAVTQQTWTGKQTTKEASDDKFTVPAYKTYDVEVPEGYEAIHAGIFFNQIKADEDDWEDGYEDEEIYDTWKVVLWVHDAMVSYGPDNLIPKRFRDIDNVGGTVPITVYASSTYGWAASVSLLCKLTKQARREWQLDTYEKIRQKYEELKSKYREQVQKATIEREFDTSAVSGRNPQQNRQIERDELKKNVVTLLEQNHLDIGAIVDHDEDFPDIDFEEHLDNRDTIRFLEHAFEWPNMAYVFYPYYWARREQWEVLQQLSDQDPKFTEFLKAGAARVIVPVRPGYREDVLHYLAEGEVYRGEGPPTNTEDERYLSHAEEIKQKRKPTEDYDSLGDSFTFTLPTQLVKLQQSEELPDFEPFPEIGDSE